MFVLDSRFKLSPSLSLTARLRSGSFSPSALFANGEPGVWFDPSPETTFTDTAGTTPATVGSAVALMLDKSKGLVLGSELVTNGTFDSDTSGWSPRNANSGLTAPSGRLVVTALAADVAYAHQSFTTVVGRTYRLSVDYFAITGTPRIYVGIGPGTNTNFDSGNLSGSGTVNVVFVATATTSVVSLYSSVSSTISLVAEFDNVTVKELPGNHATQSVTAARPILARVPARGRVNLLTRTEELTTSPWTGVDATATPTNGAFKIVADDGTIGYYRFVYTVDNNGETETISIDAKEDGARYVNLGRAGVGSWFDLRDGVVLFNGGGFTGSISEPDADGFRRVSVEHVEGLVSNGTSTQVRIYPSVNAPSTSSTASGGGNDGVKGILVNKAQRERGSLTNYQRVTDQFDVTEAGQADNYYLFHGGSADPRWMQTPSIDFTGTDKMSVFAGVRKLSDAAAAFVLEFSADTNSNNGAFYLAAPIVSGTTRSFGATSKGTLQATTFMAGNTIPAPVSATLAHTADISGDVSTLRVNGIQAAQVNTDQGTGNYGNYPLFIGARGGTSIFLNGQIYSLIVRGAQTDTPTIERTEKYVASKTAGVSL
jgi:hypothetical protein